MLSRTSKQETFLIHLYIICQIQIATVIFFIQLKVTTVKLYSTQEQVVWDYQEKRLCIWDVWGGCFLLDFPTFSMKAICSLFFWSSYNNITIDKIVGNQRDRIVNMTMTSTLSFYR